MNEKLTLQDCFKYPNAKIKYLPDENKENIFCMIVDYAYDGCLYDKMVTLNNFEKFDLFDCKLILRPLSSLTDEEKRRCKQLRAEYGILNSKGIINEADYLRSINIHVGDLPEGLFEYE